MHFESGNLYHIYNQGNNKRLLFHSDSDYINFIKLTRNKLLPHCEIVSYCLMPNHFHFIIYIDDRVENLKKQGGLMLDPVTNGIREILSFFARYYNKKYEASGSLFRQKTKSKLLTDPQILDSHKYSIIDYCTACFNYIHQNPLKAGLVMHLKDWKFSSYLDYADLRNGSLCNKIIAAMFCGYDTKTFVENAVKEIDDSLVRFDD